MYMRGELECWYYTDEIAQNANSAAILANDITVCILNATTVLLVVFSNGFVIVRYLRTRSRQPVSNSLLFLIAVFDFLQGIIPQPLFITVIMLKLHENFQCGLHTATRTAIIIFSGFSFVMATIILTTDRLLAVIFPIWHRFIMKKKHAFTVCLFLFVVWAAVISIIIHYYHRNLTIVRPLLLSVILFGLIYTVVVYVKIYFVCWGYKRKALHSLQKFNSNVSVVHIKAQDSRKEHNHDGEENPDGSQCQSSKEGPHVVTAVFNASAESPQHSNKGVKTSERLPLGRGERKTIKRMLCIVGALYLCNTPALIFFINGALNGYGYYAVSYFYPWITTFFFFNSVLNPLILCYKNEHFRLR